MDGNRQNLISLQFTAAITKLNSIPEQRFSNKIIFRCDCRNMLLGNILLFRIADFSWLVLQRFYKQFDSISVLDYCRNYFGKKLFDNDAAVDLREPLQSALNRDFPLNFENEPRFRIPIEPACLFTLATLNLFNFHHQIKLSHLSKKASLWLRKIARRLFNCCLLRLQQLRYDTITPTHFRKWMK